MKKINKYGIASFTVCALLVLVLQSYHLPAWLPYVGQSNTTQTEPLINALNATGAKLHDFSINGWAELPSKDLSDSELNGLVETAMAELGIATTDYKLTHNRSQRHRIARAEAADNRFHAVAIAQVMHLSTDSARPEVYLVVNIEAISDYGPIDAWRQKVNTIIKRSGGEPSISTCLTGWFDGKLVQEDRVKLLTSAYAALGGTVHDQVNYANFSSFSGYTPKIADSLHVGGKRINVNMAMRYSPYDNRTYVLVGSPVITREH